MVGMYIIIPIVTFIIGGLLAWLGMRFLLKSKYDSVLQEAGEGGRGDKEEQDAGSKGEVSSFESGLGKTGITA